MHLSQYNTIIFDWDGTLMDSVPKIVACAQATARELGVQSPSEMEVRNVIGLSLSVALERWFGVSDITTREEITAIYRHYYLTADQTPSPLFAQSENVLNELKAQGYTLAVATGKQRAGLDRVWQETGTQHFFTTSRCADETESKPHPAMIQEITTELGKTAQEVIMIGDSAIDMEMANRAGVDAVGVNYGAHPTEVLEAKSPRAVISCISELPEVLRQLQARTPVL